MHQHECLQEVSMIFKCLRIFWMSRTLVLRYGRLKISIQCNVAIYFMIGIVFTHKALWLILILYTTNQPVILIQSAQKKLKTLPTHPGVVFRNSLFSLFLHFYRRNTSLLGCLHINKSLERDFVLLAMSPFPLLSGNAHQTGVTTGCLYKATKTLHAGTEI